MPINAGELICIEGACRVGKTTLCKRLVSKNRKKYKLIYGSKDREVCLDGLNNEEKANFFMDQIVKSYKKVNQAKINLTDRSIFSTYALHEKELTGKAHERLMRMIELTPIKRMFLILGGNDEEDARFLDLVSKFKHRIKIRTAKKNEDLLFKFYNLEAA